MQKKISGAGSGQGHAGESAFTDLIDMGRAGRDFEFSVLDPLAVDPDGALLDHPHALRVARHELRLAEQLREADTAVLALDRDRLDILGYFVIFKPLNKGLIGLFRGRVAMKPADELPGQAQT